MIIDAKGRIFGKVNILDLLVLAIFVLGLFIAIKFIFFKPNFFHYKNMFVEVSFSGVPLNYLVNFSNEKNYLYLDNESYLLFPDNNAAVCSHKTKDIQLAYHSNSSYSILAKTITVNCSHNNRY